MREIIDDFIQIENSTDVTGRYSDMISSYNFTNDIPKYKLFIKLNPNITQSRREQIADGVRSYFRDDRTILLDKQEAL